MKKTVMVYALFLALMVFVLKMLEYRLWVRELPVEHYVGIVALIFTVVGIWAGIKITRRRRGLLVTSPVQGDVDAVLKQKGISRREYEVLELMAKGFSNQEIADKLFISLNTVKTHTSNLFVKLDAKRRTQAIEHAKREGLIAR